MSSGGRPGVPVAEGGDGSAEANSIEGPGDVGGVGVIPEETAFLGWHFRSGGLLQVRKWLVEDDDVWIMERREQLGGASI